MQEIWKPIKNYEELYMISNLGNIKSIGVYQYDFILKKKKYKKICKCLKATIDKGYMKVHLSKDGKRKTKYIHQLVADAFISNPYNYKEVNHKDSNPSNNIVDNLEWCSREYNLKYMSKHQDELKELNEMKTEILETIYYGIQNGNITTLDEVEELIKSFI